MESIKIKEKKKVFDNPVFEALTRTHIAIPLSIFYGSSLIIFLYMTIFNGFPVVSAVAYFFGGFMLFTLVEYLVHRYMFHMRADTPARRKMQYAFHGVHHEYPKDKGRLAMPPLLSITLAVLFLSFYNFIMGHPGFLFGAGFMTGYSAYLTVHYIVHAWRPPKNMFKILWKNHAIHHYQDHNVGFGVSSPFWDVIFGTLPPKPGKKSK